MLRSLVGSEMCIRDRLERAGLISAVSCLTKWNLFMQMERAKTDSTNGETAQAAGPAPSRDSAVVVGDSAAQVVSSRQESGWRHQSAQELRALCCRRDLGRVFGALDVDGVGKVRTQLAVKLLQASGGGTRIACDPSWHSQQQMFLTHDDFVDMFSDAFPADTAEFELGTTFFLKSARHHRYRVPVSYTHLTLPTKRIV
eukprot:TRINITY_DN13399_c0_g1_i1.p1 TRINITY_DN13399_c0_g1~~TRINITY_DN13399_c0_g1_i1.p1  ORF type:complete len:199 (-),score=32.92 TRINITY_DN13399_c0_g1_i1:27-623(-)